MFLIVFEAGVSAGFSRAFNGGIMGYVMWLAWLGGVVVGVWLCLVFGRLGSLGL